MHLRTTMVINRPIQEVWAYLDNHRNDLEWRRPSLQRLEVLGTGAVGPGTRYEGVVAIGPKKYPYVNELTLYEPPIRVAWKAASSAGWLIGREGSYTLETEGQGRTRYTHEITLEPNKFLGRLVEPIASAMGSKAMGPLMKQLKEALEQKAS